MSKTQGGFVCPKIAPNNIRVLDLQDAIDYGPMEAMILHHIKFWLLKNKDNQKVNKDGKVWMYTPVRKLVEVFPCFTERQIRTRLKNLEKLGALVISNHAERANFHTHWYTLNDSLYTTFFAKNQSVTPADKNVGPGDKSVRTKKIYNKINKKNNPLQEEHGQNIVKASSNKKLNVDFEKKQISMLKEKLRHIPQLESLREDDDFINKKSHELIADVKDNGTLKGEKCEYPLSYLLTDSKKGSVIEKIYERVRVIQGISSSNHEIREKIARKRKLVNQQVSSERKIRQDKELAQLKNDYAKMKREEPKNYLEAKDEWVSRGNKKTDEKDPLFLNFICRHIGSSIMLKTIKGFSHI